MDSARILFVLTAVAALGLGCGEEKVSTSSAAPPRARVSQALVHDGHDYLFVRAPRTWFEAGAVCASLGAGLVTVNDAREQAFLRSLEGVSAFWLGANDHRSEGTWSWSQDRSPYTNWAPGQPDNARGLEDCAQDNTAGTGPWSDVSCDTRLPFICESLGDSAPRIVRAVASAPVAEPGQSLTFEVSALAPRGGALSFSWSASTGTLGAPTSSGDTRRVVWTAPPRCGPVTVSVEVTDASGERNSVSFPVTLQNCRPACTHLSAAALTAGRISGASDLAYDENCNAYVSTILNGTDYIHQANLSGIRVWSWSGYNNLQALAWQRAKQRMVVMGTDNSTCTVSVSEPGQAHQPRSTGAMTVSPVWSSYVASCSASIAVDEQGCIWDSNFNGHGRLACVNDETGSATVLTTLPAHVDGISTGPDDSLFVSSGRIVYRIDKSSGERTPVFTGDALITDFAVDANGDLYVETLSSQIFRVTAGTVTLFARVSGHGKLAIAPDGFLVRMIPTALSSTTYQEWPLGT